ncbi:MAG: TrmB family transcriptional regulator [Candidatus Nanoarchaeia archaeon]
MRQDLFEGIGLTRGETKVYHTLLRTGETTTGKIIEKSGLSSGKIYEILDKLVQKGLVSYIVKERTKYFSACSPNRIVDFVKRKESELKKKEEQVIAILPDLLMLYEGKQPDYSAKIFKGLEGLRTVLNEILDDAKKEDVWLAMGVAPQQTDQTVNIFWKQWHRKRARRGIACKMQLAERRMESWFLQYKKMELRHVPGVAAASISLLGDNVVIFTWEELSALVIRNEEIAETFRSMFYGLWELGTPLQCGE